MREVGTRENFTCGSRYYYGSIVMYTKPSKELEGAAVQVDVSGRRSLAWFPLKFPEDQCLPQSGEWVEMDFAVLIPRGDTAPYHLVVGMLYGGCGKACKMTIMEEGGPHSLSVVGYGPSEWRDTKPDRSCRIKEVSFIPYFDSIPPCVQPPPFRPPAPHTETDAPYTVSILVVSVVVMVVTMVATVVMVVVKWWQRSTSDSDDKPLHM